MIRQGKASLLLVDDDPDLLRLLSIRLKANQYDVTAVDSGPLGIAIATYASPANLLDKTQSTVPPGGVSPMSLFASTDGEAWSVTPMTDIGDGQAQWVNWLAVGRNQIVFGGGHGGDAATKQTTDVYAGTPRR